MFSITTQHLTSYPSLTTLVQHQLHVVKWTQRNVPCTPQKDLLLNLTLRHMPREPNPILPQHYREESQKLHLRELPAHARSCTLAKPDKASLYGASLASCGSGAVVVVHPAIGV